ncbi:MAG: hypothetical protein BGO70_13930 [Bacteroidetes bacterium 43-93]|nr:DUF2971 domain-containing protein [Bacteroidota bacterium]OJW99530.1 MAG: hypothetical protein BGO70_13930 [Bacteroidetes bacterium 43-93]
MNIAEFNRKTIPDLQAMGFEFHDFTKPVYKYTSIESAKKIFTNKSVLFRTPNSFNDPFEFHSAFVDFNASLFQYRQFALKILVNNPKYKDNPSLLMKDMANYSRKDFIEGFKKADELERNSALLFCTSLSFMKVLMWSHYAEKHTGVCIGLKILPVDNNLMTLKVKYSDKIEPQKYFSVDNKSFSALIPKMFTKAKEWEYEEEVRTLIATNEHIPNDGALEVGLRDIQICELYYGIKTPEEQIQEIESILKERKYPIGKKGRMKMRQDAFAIYVDPM